MVILYPLFVTHLFRSHAWEGCTGVGLRNGGKVMEGHDIGGVMVH